MDKFDKRRISFSEIRIMSKQLYIDLYKILDNKSAELCETTNVKDLEQLENILNVATQQLQSGQTESKLGALQWITLLYDKIMPKMVCWFIFTIK